MAWTSALSLLPVYGHIAGYLHRWSVCRVGRLSVRLHRILTADGTPFVHTHPFHYVSIVLWGGYSEQFIDSCGMLQAVSHRPGAIILRSATAAHRITHVNDGCMTLFFALSASSGGQGWQLHRRHDIAAPLSYIDWPDGVYRCEGGFRKRSGGVWFALRGTLAEAKACERISIRQDVRQAEECAAPGDI